MNIKKSFYILFLGLFSCNHLELDRKKAPELYNAETSSNPTFPYSIIASEQIQKKLDDFIFLSLCLGFKNEKFIVDHPDLKRLAFLVPSNKRFIESLLRDEQTSAIVKKEKIALFYLDFLSSLLTRLGEAESFLRKEGMGEDVFLIFVNSVTFLNRVTLNLGSFVEPQKDDVNQLSSATIKARSSNFIGEISKLEKFINDNSNPNGEVSLDSLTSEDPNSLTFFLRDGLEKFIQNARNFIRIIYKGNISEERINEYIRDFFIKYFNIYYLPIILEIKSALEDIVDLCDRTSNMQEGEIRERVGEIRRSLNKINEDYQSFIEIKDRDLLATLNNGFYEEGGIINELISEELTPYVDKAGLFHVEIERRKKIRRQNEWHRKVFGKPNLFTGERKLERREKIRRQNEWLRKVFKESYD